MNVDLTAGIVRIIRPGGETAGTGFLVTDDGLIATCAHVVAGAGAGPGDTVRVVFHATGEEREALVEPDWWRGPNAEDVAVLRLDGPVSEGAMPLSLGSSAVVEGHALTTFGFPDPKPVEGMAGKCEAVGRTTERGFPVLQLRSSEVAPGFSGAPLLDTVTRRVVGMVTAITVPDQYGRLAETAFITPTETLWAVCPNLIVHPPPDPLDEYRDYVLRETRFVTMKGVPLPAGVGQVPLDKVYVQLQAVKRETREHQREAERGELLDRARAEAGAGEPVSTALLRLYGEQFYRQGSAYRTDERPEPISPTKAVQEHQQLVILGAPGAGKSTLLRYLARQAAKQRDGAIPIIVSARDYATARANDATLGLREFAFDEIAKYEPESIDALRKANQNRHVLWLVDALDEARGEYALEAAQQAKYLQGQVVVTSRPVGYPGGLEEFPHFEILPLTPEDVDQFTTDWLDLLTEQSDRQAGWVDERVAWLNQALDEQPRLKPLVRNPLLLTFLVILASDEDRGHLPETRGELYAEYVRRLIKSWEQQREIRLDHRGERVLTVGDLEGEAAFQAVLHGFHYLGWRLHLLYYGGEAEQEPDRDSLTEALADYLSQHHTDLVRGQNASTTAKAIVDFWLDAGILDGWDTEHSTLFTFRHLTFQEYAAGVYLAQAWQDDPRSTWRWLKPRLHLPTWREPLLLMSGELSQAERGAMIRHLLRLRCPLLEVLYPAHNLYEGTLHRGLRLAAAVLGEGQPVEAGLVQRVVRRVGRLSRRSIWRKRDVFLLMDGLNNSHILFWGIQPKPFVLVLGEIGNPAAVPYLIKALSASHSFVRMGAALSLGKIGDHTAIPHLVEALGDSEELVRGVAASSLGKISGPTAVPYLIEMLGDSDTWVHGRAVEALREIGDPVVPYLAEALGNSDKDVRGRAAWALGRIGDSAAVPYIVEALDDNEWRIRQSAAWALGDIGDPAAVPHLVEALGDSDKWVRESVVEALRKIGDPAAVPHLVEALDGSDEDMRARAAEVLGEIGDPTAVPHLVKTLCNSDIAVRLRAAEALGCIGDPAAVPSLVEVLADSEWSVRRSAVWSLVQISDPAIVPHLVKALGNSDIVVCQRAAKSLKEIGDPAIPHLINALDDIVGSVRAGTAETLGEIGDPIAVPYLVDVLDDSELLVRRSAAEALGHIGDPAAVPRLIKALSSQLEFGGSEVKALGDIGDPAVPYLLKALDNSDRQVRLGAAWALRRIGHPAAIPHFVEALGHSNGGVRWSAAEALGDIGDSAVVFHLIKALNDSDIVVRMRATEALGRIGDPAAVDYLVEALGDEDNYVRRKAAEALGEIGDPAAVAGLSKMLGDSDVYVCESAAEALERIGDPVAVPYIVEVLGDSDGHMRYAAQVLRKIASLAGDSASVPYLAEVLNDSDWHVRMNVSQALGCTGDAAAIPALSKALSDSNDFVRGSAATALGDIGDLVAVSALSEALGDSDEYVRWNAARALERIGGPVVIPHLVKALRDSDEDVRWSVAEALQSIILKQSDRGILRRLLYRLWWSLTVSPEAWKVMDRVAQQLAIVEAGERPAKDIVIRTQSAANMRRTAVGAFLTVLGLLLFGLGQDVVSNLLVNQLGPHAPPGLQGALALVGMGLLLGGLALLLQRWLSRLAS